MAPHIPDMREALAAALGTPVSRVSIKAKTTEGMGFTGRGEGIASHAIALLQPADAVLSRVDLKEQICRSPSQPKE